MKTQPYGHCVKHFPTSHLDNSREQYDLLAHLDLYYIILENYHKLDRFKMPSSYTPQQKVHISQFVGFTSTKDSVAAKVSPSLDNISWALTLTLNATFLVPAGSGLFRRLLDLGKSD